MSQVSRPMQVALLATALIAVVWFVALRPKPARVGAGPVASATPEQQAPSAPDPAPAATPAKPATGTPEGHRTPVAHRARRAPADPNVRMVRAALRQHKAIAIAFVNPKVSDARAVSEELRHVDRFGGRAVTLSVPIARLSHYGFITREVDVTVAPTTVIVAPDRKATTIVGFSDRFEIEQRLADALAVKGS